MNVILPNGLSTIIDDEDYPLMAGLNWRAKWDSHTLTYYVMASFYRNKKRVWVMLHRHLVGLEEGDSRKVDHANGNGLDNRHSVNLRIATNQQNCWNGRPKANLSGRKGVTWHAPTEQWRARIRTSSGRVHLGLFPTAEAAHAAYCEAANRYHGEFARPS